jgi:hypothetical protein
MLPAAKKERCLIDPAAVGVDRIGHLGLFHDRFRDTLWPLSGQWLRGRSPRARPCGPADLSLEAAAAIPISRARVPVVAIGLGDGP